MATWQVLKKAFSTSMFIKTCIPSTGAGHNNVLALAGRFHRRVSTKSSATSRCGGKNCRFWAIFLTSPTRDLVNMYKR